MTTSAQKRTGWLTALDTRRLVVAILFILLFAMAVRIPTDTDTWWHLRAGDYMIEHRAVLLADPFSLTRLGAPWIDHSWGDRKSVV